MISWTIPGTVAGLTGVTTLVESSSSSRSGSAQYGPVFPGSDSASFAPNYAIATGSFTENATYTFEGYTSHDAQGSTTYFSSSSSFTYTEQWGLTGSAYDDSDGEPVLTDTNTLDYSNSNSASTSGSGQTTSNLTALVQTSTTATYASAYDVFYTTSLEDYEDDEQENVPVWTTSVKTISGETKTSVSFYTTHASSISTIEFSYLTRAATSDAVTTLDQTITLSAMPNTVVQAETRYPNAEVIYLQTAQIDNVDGYTAATNVAQSGTRFTVSPVIITAAKAPANYTRPTSFIASQQSTSLVNLTSSTSTQATRTIANYFSFPPTTTTQAASGISTKQISYATNLLSLQEAITHGGATDTVAAKEFGTYWRAVTRQIGSRTFQGAVQDATSYSVKKTIEAAATSSAETSGSDTFDYGIFYGLTVEPNGESESESYRSSGVTANTVLPTAQAAIAQGPPQPQQLKYGTIGAAINGDVGGWLTANATSVGFVFFGNIAANIYAKDGAHRSATTMFPATNQKQTIVGNSITWTASTAGILSIDGATSKKTTTSAEIGVGGTAQTTTISRSISNFGGSAGAGETFVQTAHPGVYKNRINGATTFFDGSASVISNGQSQSLAMWQAIRGVVSMVSATNANPVTWAEARNNIGLPPYT